MGVLDRFRLDGRRALVTGGNRGLGRVFAEALAEAGAEVAVVSTRVEEARRAAEEIAAATGRRLVGLGADVAEETDIHRMAAEVRAALGPIDILVNNAGINIRKDAFELSVEEWDRQMAVNLRGPLLCCRAFGPGMVERKWGRIVNVASMLAFVGLERRPAYTASKGGLVQLTRTLALEWATHNVLVNALCPGPFATEINKVVLEDPEANRRFLENIPLGRWGEPRELGPAVVFLSSEACGFTTGAMLTTDGGWTAR